MTRRTKKIALSTVVACLVGVPLIGLTLVNLLFSLRRAHKDDEAPCPSRHPHDAATPRQLAPPRHPSGAANDSSSSYHPLSLQDLARSDDMPVRTCPPGLILRQDRHGPPSRWPRGPRQRAQFEGKIPRIVHQTSKSRCLAKNVYDLTETWQFHDNNNNNNNNNDSNDAWEYYLHDDEAMERLFVQEAVHFPLLPMISRHCLVHGTLKADLWRYLVLWVYGGIYADLDTAPNALDPDGDVANTTRNVDALFVVEQYHMLSQYFMAVAPRHPLMWYAVQRALLNLWDLPDTGQVSAALATGPHALHAAYADFRRDAGHAVDPAGTGHKPVWAGRFVGTRNATVTVVGVGERQNEFVHRDLLGMQKKEAAYRQMHMRHFQKDKKFPTGRSCLSTVLEASYRGRD